MKLVGKQGIDFTNSEGKQVQGLKLHYLYKEMRVDGEAVATQFFNIEHPLYETAKAMPLGDFEFSYGPKGRILDIQLPVSGK